MKIIIFLFVLLQISCSFPKSNEPIEVIIKLDQSYEIDLTKGLYTVHYFSKLPTEIKFNLDDHKLEQIHNLYYDLKLDTIKQINEITGNIYIGDKCMIMPKDKTILQVQTKQGKQEIQIDLYCGSFYSSNKRVAINVQKFINYVLETIKAKPEVKNAPRSDIMYM